jgi:hypothetical protein
MRSYSHPSFKREASYTIAYLNKRHPLASQPDDFVGCVRAFKRKGNPGNSYEEADFHFDFDGIRRGRMFEGKVILFSRHGCLVTAPAASACEQRSAIR